MDKNNGVKVTFIETQFVASDAASFKSVVQRLTGKAAGASPPLHRARPCRVGADAGADGRRSAAGVPQSCYVPTSAVSVSKAGVAGPAAPPCLEELHEICDFSELFYVGASERRHGGGSYNGFPY